MSVAATASLSMPTLRSSRRRHAWRAAALAPLGLAAVGLLAGFVQPERLAIFVHVGILCLLLAACTATDLRTHRIPNWATYTAVAWALLLNALVSAAWGIERFEAFAAAPRPDAWFAYVGPIGVWASLGGAAACFGVMCLVHYVAGSGAGDVKLATAIGALLGAGPGLAVIAWCHVAAGVAVVAWLVWATGPWSILKALGRLVGSKLMPARIAPPGGLERALLTRPVPMAAFFAVGTLLTVCERILP